jgi:hypothetical protein
VEPGRLRDAAPGFQGSDSDLDLQHEQVLKKSLFKI